MTSSWFEEWNKRLHVRYYTFQTTSSPSFLSENVIGSVAHSSLDCCHLFGHGIVKESFPGPYCRCPPTIALIKIPYSQDLQKNLLMVS